MSSKRQRFIELAKQGGNRKDFVKLANELGMTDKTEPAPKQDKNKTTEAFKKASQMKLSGKEKTNVFKRLYGLTKGAGSKVIKGTGEPEQDIQGDPISGEGLLIEPKMIDRDKKRKGGLVKTGHPRIAKKGWK